MHYTLFTSFAAVGCLAPLVNSFVQLHQHQGSAVAKGSDAAFSNHKGLLSFQHGNSGSAGMKLQHGNARIQSQHKSQQKQRDIPGGPREQPWTMFEKPTVPFKYVNIYGWDDQWHSMHPAAPEEKLPPGSIQVPNPSNFTLVPIVVAPEDKWPQSSQDGALDISGTVHRKIFQKSASMGGSARFGPAWFMRNYRPVVAPEDRVPQEFYNYFEGYVAQGKVIGGKKKAALNSLRGKGQSSTDQASQRAEDAADEAAQDAAQLEHRLGAREAKLPRVEEKDDSLALAESMVADAGKSVVEASSAEQDLRRESRFLTTPAPRIWHLKP